MAKNVEYNDWKVQLAKNYEPGKIKDGTMFSISRKINGCRATFYQNKLISRSGKKFIGFENIIEQLKLLNRVHNNQLVFDGELIYDNTEGLTDNEAFKKGTGIANTTLDMSEKHKLKFVIFDNINYADFVDEVGRVLYIERLINLHTCNKLIIANKLDKLSIVEVLYTGVDVSAIEEYMKLATVNKWEGIVINLDRPYEFKRSSGLLKYKKFLTVDLQVEYLEEGQGKYKGTLGALVCKMIDDNLIEKHGDFKLISVGSGFDDNERNEIWNNGSKYVNSIIECKYAPDGITSDKQSNLNSLQFPVFKSWRYDK